MSELRLERQPVTTDAVVRNDDCHESDPRLCSHRDDEEETATMPAATTAARHLCGGAQQWEDNRTVTHSCLARAKKPRPYDGTTVVESAVHRSIAMTRENPTVRTPLRDRYRTVRLMGVHNVSPDTRAVPVLGQGLGRGTWGRKGKGISKAGNPPLRGPSLRSVGLVGIADSFILRILGRWRSLGLCPSAALCRRMSRLGARPVSTGRRPAGAPMSEMTIASMAARGMAHGQHSWHGRKQESTEVPRPLSARRLRNLRSCP
ncbi:hypothetical protein HNR07_002553 [Nocardiopsis metallicus]|uniref:Uncharacterized protein n=1 Tax=Nocardiopsis metallicus TaxID=179819 RepID=A0A840WIS0_9ACTN|nr:hypothetical protein [Nocardiopsis metallicus]